MMMTIRVFSAATTHGHAMHNVPSRMTNANTNQSYKSMLLGV
jgi:hypothetical protein